MGVKVEEVRVELGTGMGETASVATEVDFGASGCFWMQIGHIEQATQHSLFKQHF